MTLFLCRCWSCRYRWRDPWQQFARIGLPVGLPGILAALTMSFLDAWNALEQPMTFLKTQSLWSLSLYLTDTTATWH